MKKINNRGWGFSTFIAFIAVFCIAIILIITGSIRLGISSKDDTSNVPITEVKQTPVTTNTEEDYFEQVKNYQEQLTDVSKDYMKAKALNVENGDSLTITVGSLVNENYISKLEINGNICTGYITIFNNNNNNYEYKPMVNCGNDYVTEKYDSSLDESF